MDGDAAMADMPSGEAEAGWREGDRIVNYFRNSLDLFRLPEGPLTTTANIGQDGTLQSGSCGDMLEDDHQVVSQV